MTLSIMPPSIMTVSMTMESFIFSIISRYISSGVVLLRVALLVVIMLWVIS